MGTLYIVPTPLGNLEDITVRALRILREVSLIACEDTRTTKRLLKHFEISCPTISYHDHSHQGRTEQVLHTLSHGDVALVSEAGTPLLSDPGYKLVQAAVSQNIDVVSLPGPSAITTALAVAGLPTDRFLFMGFLPRKRSERSKILTDMSSQMVTLVFFEAPHRIRAVLADMAQILGGERPVVVCRELTKLYEEIWRGTLTEALSEWTGREPRGEFTLVVAGSALPKQWAKGQVEEALLNAFSTGATSKDAVRLVTDDSRWAKRDVYALAQQLKSSHL